METPFTKTRYKGQYRGPGYRWGISLFNKKGYVFKKLWFPVYTYMKRHANYEI